MTDARLPGYWLNEMRFQDLSDKQWRVFTGLLMWSVEQGTDGHVPTRYIGTVHLDGVDDADLDALAACGVLERVKTGVQMLRWDDPNGLRQSSAATVAAYRDRKRANQASYRERLKSQSVTGNGNGNMTGQVGGGFKSLASSSSAYVAGNQTDHVTGNAGSTFPKHKHEQNAIDSLTRICRERRLPLSAEDLLPEAYRIGNGDPWDGYLEISAATEKGFGGARNPAAVLRKRLSDISGPRPVVAKSDAWMYPPDAKVRIA